MSQSEIVSVRYMVDDVAKAIDFYTQLLGFEVLTSFPPAFADVKRGNLRLLLSGPSSSAGRPMPDGAKPGPGGWNRIHLIVGDIASEVARLRDAGAAFRNDILAGPGGKGGQRGRAVSTRGHVKAPSDPNVRRNECADSTQCVDRLGQMRHGMPHMVGTVFDFKSYIDAC